MEYAIKYDPQENVIKVSITGRISIALMEEVIKNVTQVAKLENCVNILTDLRTAEWGLSMMETYGLTKVILEIANQEGVNPYKFNRVFVVEKGGNALDFYEDVSFNQGVRTRLFHTIEDASRYFQKINRKTSPLKIKK